MRTAQITITVLDGQNKVASIAGRTISMETILVGDLIMVVETEQWLEKLTGYRFHIGYAEVGGPELQMTGDIRDKRRIVELEKEVMELRAVIKRHP